MPVAVTGMHRRAQKTCLDHTARVWNWLARRDKVLSAQWLAEVTTILERKTESGDILCGHRHLENTVGDELVSNLHLMRDEILTLFEVATGLARKKLSAKV